MLVFVFNRNDRGAFCKLEAIVGKILIYTCF